ncbi:hypothetical protein BRC99_00975 [Halobacteriales archaeon QS_7_69_60]|nr:MAG: hypothetical protein BRC99_00975 [Halobacteriales archaeon QS_7_69_60]
MTANGAADGVNHAGTERQPDDRQRGEQREENQQVEQFAEAAEEERSGHPGARPKGGRHEPADR